MLKNIKRFMVAVYGNVIVASWLR